MFFRRPLPPIPTLRARDVNPDVPGVWRYRREGPNYRLWPDWPSPGDRPDRLFFERSASKLVTAEAFHRDYVTLPPRPRLTLWQRIRYTLLLETPEDPDCDETWNR